MCFDTVRLVSDILQRLTGAKGSAQGHRNSLHR